MTSQVEDVKRVNIFKDGYDKKYKVDWEPESNVRDRSPRGFDTLKAARRYVAERNNFPLVPDAPFYVAQYVGER